MSVIFYSYSCSTWHQFLTACVMNFFTPFSAYALYPCSTFLKRRTLVFGVMLPATQLALNKYKARGWTHVYAMTAKQLLRHEASNFKTNSRWIGNAICWVYRQESDMFISMGEDVMWHLQYNIINTPIATEQEMATTDFYYPVLQVIN